MGPEVGGRERPPVDERLVAPESRYEIVDGKVVYVAPADEPHATRHSKISALVEIHAASGYDVASDMLTRTSRVDDIAPDVSVFPAARDPATGRRQLEELAFEVVNTERLSEASVKARKLVARGVRRLFAIDVERRRALEWSGELDSFRILDESGGDRRSRVRGTAALRGAGARDQGRRRGGPCALGQGQSGAARGDSEPRPRRAG